MQSKRGIIELGGALLTGEDNGAGLRIAVRVRIKLNCYISRRRNLMLHEYTAVIKGNGLTLRGGKRQYRVCYILILRIISGNQVNGIAIFLEQHVAVVIGNLNRALR